MVIQASSVALLHLIFAISSISIFHFLSHVRLWFLLLARSIGALYLLYAGLQDNVDDDITAGHLFSADFDHKMIKNALILPYKARE